MKTDIISFCGNTETVHGILNIFKNEFLADFKEYKAKERPPILKAIPYLYRIWYYSTLMAETPLSPSNFINAQVKDKFSEACRVVPVITPVYKNRLLKDFQFDYKVFSIDNHPVLQDLRLFLDHCCPDIGVDENGLLLEEERDSILEALTFKEIFYVTFLTNLSYNLNFIKKMPSINTHRAMANRSNIEVFFNLSSVEQLKKIVDSILGIASKSLMSVFEFDKKSFSKEGLMKLFQNSQSLDDFSRNIFKKLNIDIKDLDLEELYISAMEEDGMEISEDTLMALSLNVEFNFLMDAQLLTPLGHYLQLIQPFYSEETVFEFHFRQLVEAFDNDIPPIKLYFFMGNSFDITSLGKEILSAGKPDKVDFQELADDYSFEDMYHELTDYYNSDEFLDMDFGDFKMSEDELDKLINEFKGMLKPYKQASKRSSSLSKSKDKAVIKDSKLAYTFKVKHYYQKRSWQALELKGTQNLDDLANAIIKAFDLDYGHLYSFFMSNRAWDDESEITSPDNTEGTSTANKHKIHKLQLCEKQKFLFIYDFGDDIRFEVELMGAKPCEGGIDYPRIVKASKDYMDQNF